MQASHKHHRNQKNSDPHADSKLNLKSFKQSLFFLSVGFVDVETPTLFKRTPGVRSSCIVE